MKREVVFVGGPLDGEVRGVEESAHDLRIHEVEGGPEWYGDQRNYARTEKVGQYDLRIQPGVAVYQGTEGQGIQILETKVGLPLEEPLVFFDQMSRTYERMMKELFRQALSKGLVVVPQSLKMESEMIRGRGIAELRVSALGGVR